MLFAGAITTTFFKKKTIIRPKMPNIVLISIDALRPDHLSCYGYKRNTSPNIDKLVKTGTKFTQAITAGGWTGESVPSILTGVYSFTHQIHKVNSLRNPLVKTLPWFLTQRGYYSVLWTNSFPLGYLDIKDGFSENFVNSQYDDNQLTGEIINWLKKDRKNNFFFYIHYRGCHTPYRPAEPYKSMYLHDKFNGNSTFVPISGFESETGRFEGLSMIPRVLAENNITDPSYYISQYDGTISYMDAQIGQLVDNIKKCGLEGNTLIVLMSDHGEMLGEHNIYFKHFGVYEENIRVPLIISYPKLFPKGKVITAEVSLIDIVPTILELARLNKPLYLQGKSLTTFLKPFKTHNQRSLFICDRGRFAVRFQDWKLICNNINNGVQKYELYNLRNDPSEQYNLVSEKPSKFRELDQLREDSEKNNIPSVPTKDGFALTEEDKEQLRSLGYAQ